jgi:hypothetical protein
LRSIYRDHVGGGADQGRDRGADQEDLAFQYHGIAVAEVDSASAQCLQLPTLQGDTRLIALVDVVFVAGALIERDSAASFVVLVLRFCHVR